jgi:hypothetical protein
VNEGFVLIRRDEKKIIHNNRKAVLLLPFKDLRTHPTAPLRV